MGSDFNNLELVDYLVAIDSTYLKAWNIRIIQSRQWNLSRKLKDLSTSIRWIVKYPLTDFESS